MVGLLKFRRKRPTPGIKRMASATAYAHRRWAMNEGTTKQRVCMRLFISYAHEDRPFVEKLASSLRELDMSVWYDTLEVSVGDSLLDKINKGLQASDYVLVVLSKNSASSEWVRKEMNAAFFREIETKRVVLLPARLDDSAPPPLLFDKAFADFRQDFRTGLDRLLALLQPKTSFAVLGKDPGLSLDRIEFLHSVDPSQICFEVRAINNGDSAIWMKQTRLNALIETEGNGHHLFYHKIIYRVIMPCSIEADVSTVQDESEALFRGVLFEDSEDQIGYRWSGKLRYENETGKRRWRILLDMPTYFCFPAHGFYSLRFLLSQPEKDLLLKDFSEDDPFCSTPPIKNRLELSLISVNGEEFRTIGWDASPLVALMTRAGSILE